jgi:hypothetical protein
MNTTAGADIFLNLILHGTVHSHLVWIGYGYYALSFLFGVAGFKAHSCLEVCWHSSMFFFAWFVSILS